MRRLLLTGMLLSSVLSGGLPVQAQAASPASIVLTWQYTQDTTNPAVGFVVRRCVQLTTGCTMGDVSGATPIPLATLTYTDLNVSPNIQYCYEISSFNAFGRSPPSSKNCGTIGGPPSTVPQNVILKLNPAVP